jgi:hypothetical protein
MEPLGFLPAFLDFASQRIYPPRFADGSLGQGHVMDGLPDELVADRAPSGRVIRLKPTVIAGYVRYGFFYTRAAATRAAAEWSKGGAT